MAGLLLPSRIASDSDCSSLRRISSSRRKRNALFFTLKVVDSRLVPWQATPTTTSGNAAARARSTAAEPVPAFFLATTSLLRNPLLAPLRLLRIRLGFLRVLIVGEDLERIGESLDGVVVLLVGHGGLALGHELVEVRLLLDGV